MATRADEVTPDDQSASFQNHRTELAQSDAGEWLMQRAATAAATDSEQPASSPAAPDTEGGDKKSVLQRAGGAALDVGRGAVETPRAVAGGVRDAIQNTYNFTAQLGDYLTEKTHTRGFIWDDKGFRIATGAEMRQFRGSGGESELPDVADPKSVTGKALKGISQFLAGFFLTRGAGGGALSGATSTLGRVGQAATAGAITDSLVWDPHEGRLSDLVQSNPKLRNPITEFLSSKPDDNAAEGRLKNAAEGLGLGLLADGLLIGLKTLRSMRLQRLANAEASGLLPAPAEESATRPLDLRELDVLGPDDVPAVEASDKVRRAIEQTAGTAPGDVAGGDAAITARFASQLNANVEGAIEQYRQIPGTDGGRVLNVDLARELSADYAADRTLSSAVHEPASTLVKQMYERMLAEPPKEGQSPLVVFTGGGTGAGKTTGLNALMEADPALRSAQIVYDTNLNNLASSAKKIDQALEAGKDVAIGYVYRDPVESLVNGALPRAMRMGRTVPLEAHAETHAGGASTIKALAERYAGDERVSINIIANTGGRGGARVVDVGSVPEIDYNSLRENLSQKLEEEFAAGRISETVYRGTKNEPRGARAVQRSVRQWASESPERRTQVDAPDGVFINFRRIETPEDIQGAMQRVADLHKRNIDNARRGQQTFEQIKLNAEQEDAWSILMERRKGEPLNAEQSVAARRLWTSSAEKLTELANLASTSPSEANLFAFRKMLATHAAIQSEVIAARTETARSLSSWRIPVGGGQEMTRALQFVLAENGGPEVAREMAERISRLSQAGYSRELDAFVRGSAVARTRDAMMEAWINGLLSGPKTHIVNMLSNASVAGMQIYERGVAAQFNRALGDGGVQAGEAMAQWAGLVDGIRDAFRYAGKSFATGESTMGIGKVDVPNKAAVSSEALGISSGGWLGRFVDTLGHNVVRLPTRALSAEDEFFKTIGYRMELNAQAVRQAGAEVHAGSIPAEQLKARAAEIIANPPENIRLASMDQAMYQTFTNAPGKLTQLILKAANETPALRILLPFVRTPSNIMRYTFERTPLAPLMSSFRADVAAGGARRDLALARMSTGTAIMFATADMAMSGNVSGGGPANPAERQLLGRTGWQPYSVKVGNRWYAYNRADPLGMVLGMSADMSEILAYGDQWKAGADADEIAIAAAAAIGNNTMSKTYLSGLSEFFEAMSDPKRYSESYFQRLAGSLVPTGVAEVARQNDPYMREVRSWVDAMRARTPGLSDSLPVRRDVWGRTMTYQSGLGGAYDMVSPIYSRRENPEPIDKELLRLEATVSMPAPKTSFDGVTVDLAQYPGAYSHFVELAGNELKHPAWNMGAKDFLNAVVSGKHQMSEVYRIRTDGPDGGKDVFIRDTVNDYRERARRQLLEEYPDLRREVEEKQSRARGLVAGL